MYSKQRHLPLEVSTWMEKDITMKRMTATTRLLTNDTRQNVVLNRRFFSDLLSLSFARYRKITQCEFDRRFFLKSQGIKVDASGIVIHSPSNESRINSARQQSSRQRINPFLSSSFLSPNGTRSDPTFDRKQPLFSRRDRAGSSPMKAGHDTVDDIIISKFRPPTQRELSRERLNRLAQPKGSRFRSIRHDHTRSKISNSIITPEDLFGQIDLPTQETKSSIVGSIRGKPKSAAGDERFHHLVDVFSTVHDPETLNTLTVKNIVGAKPSLQDKEGQWKQTDPALINRKNEMKQHRQMLLQKLHRRVDVFLIDVGA